MGTLHVDVSTDGGMSWTLDVVPSITDNLDAWQQQLVDLTAYVGMNVNVRLRGIVGSDFESDMAIDQFNAYDAANPPEDAQVVSIDAPLSAGCMLTATETVTVTIQNNGPTDLTTVPLDLVVTVVWRLAKPTRAPSLRLAAATPSRLRRPPTSALPEPTQSP